MQTGRHLTLQIRDLLHKLRLAGFCHLMKNAAAELPPAFLLVFVLQHRFVYVGYILPYSFVPLLTHTSL